MKAVMVNKKSGIFILPLLLAVTLSFCLKTSPLEEQLLDLSVEKNISYFSKVLRDEPPATKAILIDYADNQELVLKAWIALKKYPQTAESLFFLYGQQPEFKQALLQFGEGIIPVVAYFLQHEVTSLTVQATLGNLWQGLKHAVSANEPKPAGDMLAQLTPQQRGWYAINYINQEGYNFLGQFAVDKHGNAQWIQADRASKALVSFFSGGIRELESKYKTGADISKMDLVWAGADVFVLASSVKLLTTSKAVASSKSLSYSQKTLSVSQKTSLFSAQLIKNTTVRSLVKYSAISATVYIVAAHPSLVNAMLNETAAGLGVNAATAKVLGWSILLYVVLLPLLWCVSLCLKPLLLVYKLAVPNKT